MAEHLRKLKTPRCLLTLSAVLLLPLTSCTNPILCVELRSCEPHGEEASCQ